MARPSTTTAVATSAGTGLKRDVGASGSLASDSVPRAGISLPPAIIVTMTITNGTASITPGCVQ